MRVPLPFQDTLFYTLLPDKLQVGMTDSMNPAFYARTKNIVCSILVGLALITSCTETKWKLTGPGGDIISSDNDSNVPLLLREYYTEDAALLSVRRMHQIGGSLSNEVIIPSDIILMFYKSLIRVYNAMDLAARDSVISMYDIHAARRVPDVVLHELIVSVSLSRQWTHAWQEGNRLTGNTQIDDLILEYDLELDSFTLTHSGTSGYALLIADQPLNISALASHFEGIDGVNYAEANAWAGGSDDIIVSDVHWAWVLLDYSVGYGDCPAGCIYRRNWRFQVFFNNRVVYVGSWGDQAP